MNRASRKERDGKLRVLFIAGIDPVPSGGSGGQVAEMSTVYSSALGDVVHLIPLSSTMRSVPPPSILTRIIIALWRQMRFVTMLSRSDVVFVYAGDGLTLVEKGLMCMLSRVAGKGVVVRFGSGNLPAQVKRHRCYEKLLQLVLKSAHVVSTQGPAWSQFFESYEEAKGKTFEIGNAVRFQSPAQELRRDKNLVVFAGWMQKEKGIFDALEVFKRVVAVVPDARFVLAGGGRDLQEFRGRIVSIGLEKCVTAPGWLDRMQLQNLMESASIFLFPSHYEGLPNAMLEAMGAGLACIASKVGSIPDVLEEGKSGFLVEVGDIDAIVDALLRLLRDPSLRAAIGEAARAVAVARFDVNKVWPQYHAAFLKAAEASGNRPSFGA